MKLQSGDVPSFRESSYRSQLFRLRGLAKEVIKSFALRLDKIELVNYGENAAFKVSAKNGERYLLRVHRGDYHSQAGLKEELDFLKVLRRNGIAVPQPVCNRWGKDVIHVRFPHIGLRSCDMLRWIDGRFLSRSISKADMFKIGVLLARIQMLGRKMKCKHRRYWNSDGLVGANPKFGAIDGLDCLPKGQQKKLTEIRKKILSDLKKYEKHNSRKMGLIHADLHFGNLLKTKNGEVAAIDFDDCGYGFYVYDLAIPLVGIERYLHLHGRFDLYPELKKSLLSGYSSVSELRDNDLEILQKMIVARKLVIIGWLNSRADNPKLKGKLKNYAKNTIKYFANPYL